MTDQALYKNSFDGCPLTFALTLIGGKWRLPIIWALHKNGPLRYNELKRRIDGITHMMLTQSLKELELYGLIRRRQFMEVPPRVEYSLTANGENLIPALKALADWGKQMKTAIPQDNLAPEPGEIAGEPLDRTQADGFCDHGKE